MITNNALGALITLFILCCIATVVFLIVRTKTGGVWGMLAKTVASIMFVAFAISGTMFSSFPKIALYIVLGLIFGLVGDILLDLKVTYKQHENIYLNSGMLSFACGHIMYFIASIFYMKEIEGLSTHIYNFILIALGIAFVFSTIILLASGKCNIRFGKFTYQSFFYSCILCFMSVFSICISIINPIFAIFAAGIFMILVSDLILSIVYFGNKENNKMLIILNHSIYYLGQILMAIGIFFVLL